jgi:hypothetical protein
MARAQVFISYSHKDGRWLNELRKHLTPRVREQAIRVWEDTQLRAGDRWLQSIEEALASAKVAVLLVSANYLASDFIASREIPPILQAQAATGLRIVWIPVSASAYTVTPIKAFEAACDPARPLDSLAPARRNQLWVEISEAIVAALAGAEAPAPAVPEDDGPVENRVVLLYKRGADPDERLLHLLETELKKRGFPVWLDRHLKVGMEWAKAISDRLEKAAAVIPLLSAASIHSEMLAYEVQVAHKASQRTGGKPRLLPVRLNFTEALRDQLEILNPIQHVTWRGEGDDDALVQELAAAIVRPSTVVPRYVPPVGGALPIDDEFYITRPTDGDLRAAIERKESIVLIKGARQMGKTSLLVRGLKAARGMRATTVYTDYQKLNLSQLTNLETFYKSLCEWLTEELDLDLNVDEIWNPKRTANFNLERFVERTILPNVRGHLVWAMDETDRLFDIPFKDEFFGLLRSWYNDRQIKTESGWGNLTILIAYATEPTLFISNLSQSPFNIGLDLELADFTPDQVEQMNQKYGSPLTRFEDVKSFHGLVGGQPHLVRRGLFEMRMRNYTLEQFVDLAGKDDGPYGDHLRRILVVLARNPLLSEALRQHLAHSAVLGSDAFYRLRRAGLLLGAAPAEARARCRLYADYLRRHLFETHAVASVP